MHDRAAHLACLVDMTRVADAECRQGLHGSLGPRLARSIRWPTNPFVGNPLHAVRLEEPRPTTKGPRLRPTTKGPRLRPTTKGPRLRPTTKGPRPTTPGPQNPTTAQFQKMDLLRVPSHEPTSIPHQPHRQRLARTTTPDSLETTSHVSLVKSCIFPTLTHLVLPRAVQTHLES
jgi:hypothetical protein